jgi:hypothetical protein
MLAAVSLMVGLSLVTAQSANAATITFTPSTEFSGSGASFSGTITYTLTDEAGAVRLTMTWLPATNTTEFMSGAYFNLDPALNPLNLSFSPGVGTCTNCAVSQIATGTNAFQADGDGSFDIQIDFETAAAGRFNQGDSYSVLIDHTDPGFNVNSFLFQSATGGGNGIWFTTARLQGLSTGSGSGWFGEDTPVTSNINVPEPASLSLLGLGLAVAASRLRRRRTA